MDTCRAAVVTAHNQPLEIQRVPIPELEPGALLVKIEASNYDVLSRRIALSTAEKCWVVLRAVIR